MSTATVEGGGGGGGWWRMADTTALHQPPHPPPSSTFYGASPAISRIRAYTARLALSLRVITSTASSPAMVPMISAQPAPSNARPSAWAAPAGVFTTSSGPTPSNERASSGEQLLELRPHGLPALGGGGVVGATVRGGDLGESQLPDIARQRGLGDIEPFRPQQLPELLLARDAGVADDLQDRGVPLGLHGDESSRGRHDRRRWQKGREGGKAGGREFHSQRSLDRHAFRLPKNRSAIRGRGPGPPRGSASAGRLHQ